MFEIDALKNAPPKKPSGADQVAKSASYSGTTVTILHTVTAGKTLHIVSGNLSGRGTDVAGTYFRLFVRDASDVEQYSLIRIYVDANVNTPSYSLPLSLIVPIEVAAGWDVCLVGSHANNEGHGCIQGWEE